MTRPFGRYEILDRISAGGMAEVFRARDTVKGHTIALKRLLPNIAEDDDFIRMFEDEARIARQLEHPYIARMFDYGDVDGAYYIAFEFVDGKDLRRVFDRSVQRRDPPSLSILLYIFTRIAEGLSFAHHRKDKDGRPAGIVHRDVTPQNIMISYSGDVKLIDFGIAKAKGKAVRTEAGTIKGKFGYMAPEQFTGENVDHRVDVFALGVCMWELLTLQRLFTGANELQVLDKVKNAVTVQPSHHNAAVPPELDRIVLKALAKNPDERYRAARDLYKDLYTLTQNTKAESTREDVAEYMRHAFGEGPATSGIEAVQDKQEKRVMSDNKGSDLDIFEGLGKKSQPKVSSAPPPPPPPSGQQRASEPTQTAQPAPQTFDVQKKTLMGIPQPAGSAGPPPPPPSAGRISAPPPVPPPSGSMKAAPPPPPPGRGSLPPVPGVATSPSTLPGLQAEKSSAKTDENPAPVSTRPAGNGAALEMDWDDEDEATHVYDKDSKSEAEAAAPVSQSRVPVSTPSTTTKIENKTLMGMNGPGLQAPPPPPPPPHSQGGMRSAPPIPPPPSGSMRAAAASQPPISARPPQPSHPSQSGIPAAPASVGSALARASSVPSGTPGPVSNPLPPPPPGGPTVGRSSFPPPPPPGSVQPQQHQTVTAPMPMPGRPSAHPSQVPVGSMPPSQAVASQPPRNALEPTAMVRPQGGSKAGIFVGLAVLLLAIAGAAGIFFFVMPHTGRVMINATDAKGGNVNRLEVFLDGRKQCDTTPCAVEQVSAGAHQVKVLAQGYEPATKAISVESRKDSVVDLTLVPSSAGTGIKVGGAQAGVKLFIDGKEIGPLPQEVKDLSPGDHKIRVAERSSSDPTRDRYQPLERNVIVAKDEMQDLGAQNLKVVKGKATISLATPNARVYLVSGTDRRELPSDKLPMAVDIDTSKSWTLEAVKFGFQDYKQPISFEDGQAEKTFNITLDPKGGPVASGNDSTPTPTPTFVQPQPKPQPQPQPTAATTAEKPAATAEKPAATAEKPAATAAAAGGEAFLNINSIPASSVVLDGKPIGNTPKVKVSVTPGTHTVLFINAEQGLKKQISVTVGAGETKPAIAKLKTE